MNLTLKTGRQIQVTRFQYEQTYEGLLLGKPNQRLNRAIVNQLKRPEGWPDRPYVQLIDRSIVPDELPHGVFHAWLTSTPVNEAYMASDLMITWFDEQPNDEGLQELILKAANRVNWDEKAGDFMY